MHRNLAKKIGSNRQKLYKKSSKTKTKHELNELKPRFKATSENLKNLKQYSESKTIG